MAVHYCGDKYDGPKLHINYRSQATFMDMYCPEPLSQTVFITNNSMSDVLSQMAQDEKDAYAKWKKANPGKGLTEEQIDKVRNDLKTFEEVRANY